LPTKHANNGSIPQASGLQESQLPRTGGDITGPALLGAGLVAGGVAAAVAARKQRGSVDIEGEGAVQHDR
jgi:LPXTG-motif cell wall-anchored protein